MMKLFLIILTPLAFSCSSVPTVESASDNLSLSIKRKPIQGGSGGSKGLTVTNAADDQKKVIPSVELDAEQRVDWSQYFKPPPAPQERAVLAQKISEWMKSSAPHEVLKKARGQLVLGQVASAESSYKEFLRLDPDNVLATIELAKLYLKSRRLESCVETLARVRIMLEKPSINRPEYAFQYKHILSLLQISTGEIKLARKNLSEMIAADSTFVHAYSALATTYLKENKLGAANFVARKGVDIGRDDPSLFNVLGVVAFRQRKLGAARAFFDKAIEVSPSYAPAHVNLANLALQNFEYDVAERLLAKAMNLAPDSHLAYVSMASMRRSRGQFDDAMSLLKRAIDLAPDNAAARFHLASMHYEVERNQTEALRLFAEVQQLTRDGEALHRVAGMYIADIQQARAH
jgi:Tfp pilus assembly protein PilF